MPRAEAVLRRLRAVRPRAWLLALALAATAVLGGRFAASPAPPLALVMLVPDAAALQQPAA